jgi:hypothetical protein
VPPNLNGGFKDTFETGMIWVVELHVYAVSLGYDWLKHRSHMYCHLENKTIAWLERSTADQATRSAYTTATLPIGNNRGLTFEMNKGERYI